MTTKELWTVGLWTDYGSDLQQYGSGSSESPSEITEQLSMETLPPVPHCMLSALCSHQPHYLSPRSQQSHYAVFSLSIAPLSMMMRANQPAVRWCCYVVARWCCGVESDHCVHTCACLPALAAAAAAPLRDTARALCLQIHRHSAPHTAGQQRETLILTSIRQSYHWIIETKIVMDFQQS